MGTRALGFFVQRGDPFPDESFGEHRDLPFHVIS
jgi:hypothetical protein